MIKQPVGMLMDSTDRKEPHKEFIDIFHLTTQSKGSPSSEESPPTSMPQAEGEKQETTTAEIPGVQYKVQCLGCF